MENTNNQSGDEIQNIDAKSLDKLNIQSNKNIGQNIFKFRPLVNQEYLPLNWKGPIQYPGLVRIPMDGSCFFHAIAKSYCKPYIIGVKNGISINRREFVQSLRKDLAYKLAEPIDPKNPKSPRHYDILSRGKLSEFSKAVPKYSLSNLQKELLSNRPVDNIYNEFISNQINKDIYLLDFLKQDVYITGNDSDILYKNRNSIILLTLPGHYELVGVKHNDSIQTIFKHNDPLIKIIKNRFKIIHQN